MSTLDDQWAKIHPALQQIKLDYLSPPTEPWTTQREAVLRQLNVFDPARDLVELLIAWLDELPDNERKTLLGQDELDTKIYKLVADYAAPYDQQAPDDVPAYEEAEPALNEPAPAEPAQQAADDTAYDPNAWNGYLAANGPAWNGSEESWPAFREWFLFYATEQGLTLPATGFLKLLDGNTLTGRMATFADYGITITPPVVAPPVVAPPVIAPPVAAESVAADESTTALMEELLAADPGFAEIPEQRRLELLAEVLSEEELEPEAS